MDYYSLLVTVALFAYLGFVHSWSQFMVGVVIGNVIGFLISSYVHYDAIKNDPTLRSMIQRLLKVERDEKEEKAKEERKQGTIQDLKQQQKKHINISHPDMKLDQFGLPDIMTARHFIPDVFRYIESAITHFSWEVLDRTEQEVNDFIYQVNAVLTVIHNGENAPYHQDLKHLRLRHKHRIDHIPVGPYRDKSRAEAMQNIGYTIYYSRLSDLTEDVCNELFMTVIEEFKRADMEVPLGIMNDMKEMKEIASKNK